MKTVLHLGCGGSRLDKLPKGFQTGFREIRLDINPAVEPDLLMSVKDLNQLPTGEYDALYTSHMIEHMNSYEVNPLFEQFKLILKPDGFAVITCPDILPVAQAIAAGGLRQPIYKWAGGFMYPGDVMFGYQKAISEGNHFMAHRYCFTAESLMQHCSESQFGSVIVRRRPEKLDLWAICTPHKIDNKQLSTLMNDFTFA